MWTWSTGLGIAAASGHESAAIRRAWVSGDPAGIESAAIRRALSQRRAGGHWVRGGPVAWSPANGAPGGAATRELGNPRSHRRRRISPAIGRHEGSRPADSRHSWRSRRKSHAVLQWAMAGLRSATSLLRDRHKHRNKIKLSKTRTKQNGVKGRRLRLGLVFCHGAHTREDTGTRRRGRKLK